MTNFLSGLFGKKTAPVAPATQLRIQTAVYGTPIPIGWGMGRLAGNLLYYNNFNSVQQQNPPGGGKGGGAGGGGKFGGGANQTSYYADIILGLCEGPTQLGVSDVAWSSANLTQVQALNLQYFNGTYAQTAWSYVVLVNPALARAYRGIAYMAGAQFALGTTPQLPQLQFEIAFGFFEPSATTFDANPADIIVDFCTNNHYGLGFPPSRIGDSNLATLRNYAQAVGIWMSPILTSQSAANSFLADVLFGCVAEAVWSNGNLKIVPYYDAAASGHGASYTPNLSPVYDLTDDDFIPGANNNYQSPLIVMLKAVADIYNSVKVRYLDRNYNYQGAPGTAADYNPTVIEVKDDASIQSYTLRSRDTKQLDLFCYGPAAAMCATLQLGREMVRTTYQFSLPAQFVLLEPMDLVTLTDAALGLVRKLVRIREISENEDFTLTMVAEDMLLGTASPPLYGQQAKTGHVLNTNVDPGLTLPPFFFEPTDALAGGLEVMMAVTAVSLANWGGCNVYISFDGINYQYAGQQLGPARMGVTTAAFPSVPVASTPPTIDNFNTLAVDLTTSASQLLSATANDLLALATLCYLNGEFFAYQNANPTGSYKFNLSKFVRGAYGTAPQASAAGATFVRVDKGVFSFPFTQDRIGQTVYVKLVNLNQYGAGPQTLAGVSPYTYVLKGTALTSALPDVKNFTTNYQSNITLFSWDEVKDFRNPIDYEIRRGVDWPTGQVIGRYLHPNVPAIGSTTGSTQYLIKAHCQPVTGLDVYSTNAATISITGGVIPLNIVASWDEFSGATGILTGTLAGDIYNDISTLETFEAGDLYAITSDVNAIADVYTVIDIYTFSGHVDDIYQLTDWYNFGNIDSGDVYGIADIYAIPDVCAYSSTNTVSGTYTIPAGHIVNVGRAAGCLVDCTWVSQGIPVGQNIFTWSNVFDHTDIFAASANIFVTAYPNINLSPNGVTWTGWQKYRAGFYSAMAFDLQMFLQSTDPNTIASVSAFSYAVHIPSRIDHYIGVSVPGVSGGLAITFQPDGAASAAPFNGGPGGTPGTPGLPVWQATITNEASGDLLTVSSLTLSGATVKVANAGNPVARTVNIEFAGY